MSANLKGPKSKKPIPAKKANHTTNNRKNNKQTSKQTTNKISKQKTLTISASRLQQLQAHLQVLWRYHAVEDDGPVVAEHLVGPAPDGPDKLDRSDAIVGHQDLLYGPLPPKPVHKLRWGGHLERGRGRGGGELGGGGAKRLEELFLLPNLQSLSPNINADTKHFPSFSQ